MQPSSRRLQTILTATVISTVMCVLAAPDAIAAPEGRARTTPSASADGTAPGARAAVLDGEVVNDGLLSGTVVGPDGEPLEGASVTVDDVSGDAERGGASRTGPDGGFRFENLAPATYRVVVRASGLAPMSRTVTVVAGEPTRIEIRMRLRTHTEEVTVAATGHARDVLDTPGEVSVVGRERIDELQARSLDDVLRYEPGVEFGATRRLLQTPNIRGFDEERVLVLQDGARISQFTSGHKGSTFIDVRDVERIEVVRGPASALYGSGALGGVVSIETRDPRDMLRAGETLGGSIAYTYSSAYDEWLVSPRLFGTTEGGVGFLLGYTGSRNDGVVEVGGAPGTIGAAEEDIDSFDARVTAPVGDRGWLRAAFDAYDNSGRSAVNLASTLVGPDEAIDRTTSRRTVTLSYDGATERWWSEEFGGTFYLSDLDLQEERLSDGRFDEIGFRTWGLDLRNTSSPGDGHRFSYGIELFHDREQAARNGGGNVLFPDATQTQVGIYLQDEITAAGDRLRIVPGVRWDSWSNSPDDPSLSGSEASRFNLKLGASLRLTDGVVLSGNYAEGFRAPNFQELFISGDHFRVPLGGGFLLRGIFVPNPDLEPESSRNVDLGVRYRRGGFTARAAYYRSWVDDFISTTVEEGFVPPSTVLVTFRDRNVREATLEGFEASIDWRIGDRWDLWANYSGPRGSDDETGEPLESIFPGKTAIGLEWRSPETGIVVGLASRIVEDHDRVPEDVEPLGGYTLYDVYGSWTPGAYPDVTFRFGVDNLTDEEYTLPIWRMPGTGRDFRTGVVLRFGG